MEVLTPDRDIIPRVLGGRTNEQWISQYGSSHQTSDEPRCATHWASPPFCSRFPVFVASIFFRRLWFYALALFLVGWAFQFIGHAFEGKAPEFLHDWRFLVCGRALVVGEDQWSGVTTSVRDNSRIQLMTLTRCLSVILFLIASTLGHAADAAFDIVITNGHIVDGTGSPWYSGDVGIRDGRIAAIGNLSAAARKRTIDAAGKVVAPGFIDMLGQSETDHPR